jgi:hypothetical protein
MFRHHSFIFRKSVNTKNHFSNTLFKVLIALTVIFETLKNSRMYKVDKYKPTLSWHQKYMIVSLLQYKLAAVLLFYGACIQISAMMYVI